jgi:histidyl-tRNA synthetase
MNPLPGFRDFYPEALAVRRHIFGKWRDVARRYGFREYDGPPLEPLELYTQKSGDEIVGQLFNFIDKGERAVALRPEMTPTLARMVGAHHRDYKKPIKWFAIPQLFRYEKQQRGRLREHFQFNADIIGETDIGADAELIALAIDTLRSFGLTENDFVVRINDRRYVTEVLTRLGVEEKHHAEVLAIIDKVERKPLEYELMLAHLYAATFPKDVIERVLSFIKSDVLGDKGVVDANMRRLLDLLNVKGLSAFVKPDLKIVRGLAYYSGIVWEIHDCKGELRAIAGGGRYDNLIKQVSGVDLPALGFGMGDVVLGELLKDRGLLPKAGWGLDCYVVIADESLRPEALKLIHKLREEGIAVDYSLTETKVGRQFQMADALGARFALTMGPDEWKLGQMKLKRLATGVESTLDFANVKGMLREV